jgi:hypothetical protein
MSMKDPDPQSKAPDMCRLCDNPLRPQFKLTVLGRHDVQYSKCVACGALQTEPPYWLDEAYGDAHGSKNLSVLDTGAAQRNIHNLAACFLMSKLFKLKNVIDVGGGDGLLCRLLRDYGINCYIKDKYTTPTYAQGFTEQDFGTADLVVGFEVLEHLPDPKNDLPEFFGYNPKALLLTTEIYKDQDKHWWYFSPESGQHVFFYSQEALKSIADRYGYTLVTSGGFLLLIKNISFAKSLLARILLSRVACRLMRAIFVFLPASGAWNDHLLQKKNLNSLNHRE